jgi:peptide/nickel transport system ATP-binding protein
MHAAPPDMPLLVVEDLTVSFAAESGPIVANDRVSLAVRRGETLGIVGESGSGKSVLCRAILRLLPSPPATITATRLAFEGRDLLGLDEPSLCAMRGRDIAMVFQNPMTSLDPVQPIASQVAEPLRLHRGFSRRAARAGAIELLDRVGIASAAARCDEYPHQWSGGMLQRASIAMAMAAEPKLLLADEPTTALDVTIQDQILALLLDLQRETGMAIVLVSHDMGVIAESSDRLAVMYAGRIVETGTTREVFEGPAHPYSRGLLDSIPRADERVRRLRTIPGQPPDLSLPRPGCAFTPRCAVASDDCSLVAPVSRDVAPGHATLCLHPERVGAASQAEAAA